MIIQKWLTFYWATLYIAEDKCLYVVLGNAEIKTVAGLPGKAQIPLVASRHDKHVSCVLRRACSNMADDEDAVVLACKTISCFIIIY